MLKILIFILAIEVKVDLGGQRPSLSICTQNLVKLSLIVWNYINALFSHISPDGRTDEWSLGRTDGKTKS